MPNKPYSLSYAILRLVFKKFIFKKNQSIVNNSIQVDRYYHNTVNKTSDGTVVIMITSTSLIFFSVITLKLIIFHHLFYNDG